MLFLNNIFTLQLLLPLVSGLTSPQGSPLVQGNTKRQDIIQLSPNQNFQWLRPSRKCFTQGIYIETDLSIVETCGLYDESYIRRYVLDKETAKHPAKTKNTIAVDSKYFLEGIAPVGDNFYTLTWREKAVLQHKRPTLLEEENGDVDVLEASGKYLAGPRPDVQWFPSESQEGWGLTTDGCKLYVNTGKNFIAHLDPETLEEIIRVEVSIDGRPLNKINDMMYIAPSIWANVWYTDDIYRIDPETGIVEAHFSIKGLYNWSGDATPNGIAYSYEWGPNDMLITGKLWNTIFNYQFKDLEICGRMVTADEKDSCPQMPPSPCNPPAPKAPETPIPEAPPADKPPVDEEETHINDEQLEQEIPKQSEPKPEGSSYIMYMFGCIFIVFVLFALCAYKCGTKHYVQSDDDEDRTVELT